MACSGKRSIMKLPLNQKIFEIMFKAKSDDLEVVLKRYGISREDLYDLLWEEFNIQGMEVRIANTALDFLIDCCEEEKDLEDTMIGEIRKDILMSSVFYSNVAPNAEHTTDFSI